MSKYQECCSVTLKDDGDAEWRVDIAHYDELRSKLLDDNESRDQWLEYRSIHDPEATLLFQLSDVKTVFRCTEQYCIVRTDEEKIDKLIGEGE